MLDPSQLIGYKRVGCVVRIPTMLNPSQGSAFHNIRGQVILEIGTRENVMSNTVRK